MLDELVRRYVHNWNNQLICLTAHAIITYFSWTKDLVDLKYVLKDFWNLLFFHNHILLGLQNTFPSKENWFWPPVISFASILVVLLFLLKFAGICWLSVSPDIAAQYTIEYTWTRAVSYYHSAWMVFWYGLKHVQLMIMSLQLNVQLCVQTDY